MDEQFRPLEWLNPSDPEGDYLKCLPEGWDPNYPDFNRYGLPEGWVELVNYEVFESDLP